jgi:hypothetical protein
MAIKDVVKKGISVVSNAAEKIEEINLLLKQIAAGIFIFLTAICGIWFTTLYRDTIMVPLIWVLVGGISAIVISVVKKTIISTAWKNLKENAIGIGVLSGIVALLGGNASDTAIDAIKSAIIPRLIIALV